MLSGTSCAPGYAPADGPGHARYAPAYAPGYAPRHPAIGITWLKLAQGPLLWCCFPGLVHHKPLPSTAMTLKLIGIIHLVTADPTVTVLFHNTNINDIGVDTEWTKFLGMTDSTDACGDLCMHHDNGSSLCRGFSRFNEGFAHNASLIGKCFGHLDYIWVPTPAHGRNVGTDTGRISRPCRDNLDCSLNGRCEAKTGQCTCNQGWSGQRCQTLRLAPVDRDAIGFSPTLDGLNMTSWGGSVHQVDGRWHMWASRMDNHCGIGSYLLNSRVVHAIAPPGAGSSGPYKEAESVVPLRTRGRGGQSAHRGVRDGHHRGSTRELQRHAMPV